MSGFEYLILSIIIITLFGIAVGSLPKLKMNRATIALVGATVLIIVGALNLEDAYKAIDINTIILLFSMMILNINLRLSGFFKIITSKIISLANTPKQLLALIIFSSGLLSALFLNDTIVIMFTPLILDITFSLKRNPIPYLIALATSANVGSVATIVGNPQNMIIGMFSKISFVDFAIRLTPIALFGLVIIWLIITGIYKKEFKKEKLITPVEEDYRVYRPLLIKSTIVLFIMLTAFNLGFPVSLSALGGAALLLITRRIKPERVFIEIDWSLLVFFSGLFIITHTINQYFISSISSLENYSFTGNFIWDFSIVSAILSNIISNVPAVLILSPAVIKIPNPEAVWLALAMSSTFAGNLTLIGSVANLIVAESAKKRGVKLEFYEYLKTGLPVTIITLILGIVWLSIL
ncbi:MAG TPA: anion transporter [Ignavibacteriaceae bacterium]|nr:anion transporter [Ignavibacteriaceae bacterium]